MTVLRPGTCGEVADVVRTAVAACVRLEIRGGGSKADVGAPCRGATILCTGALSGVTDYDPAEMVLTAGAGTPLAQIEALTAANRQGLAFEPFDHGPLFGRLPGATTLGGVVAAAVAGPARLSAGGARDHLLGFTAVSGSGDVFAGGGKVVKNVTGYDMPKIVTGSWGRLCVLTQVTLRVLPLPRAQTTVVVAGLGAEQAHAAMTRAMRSRVGVAAAAHLPASVNGGRSTTAFRLVGFAPSVAQRRQALETLLAGSGAVERLDERQAERLWAEIRVAAPLAGCGTLWRVNVAPSEGYNVATRLERQGARWMSDWAGGLLWIGFNGDPARVRTAAAAAGGHATLVRAPPSVRLALPAQQPEPPGVAALSRRIRRAFDPAGVFETNRFLDVAGAD